MKRLNFIAVRGLIWARTVAGEPVFLHLVGVAIDVAGASVILEGHAPAGHLSAHFRNFHWLLSEKVLPSLGNTESDWRVTIHRTCHYFGLVNARK